MAHRARVLASHCSPAGGGAAERAAAPEGGRAALGRSGLDFLSEIAAWPDRTRDLAAGDDVATHLPGPQHDTARYPTKFDVIRQQMREQMSGGEEHILWCEWQKRYGDAGLSSNLIMPVVVFGRDRAGKAASPYVSQQVLVSHPDDCARLARDHLEKQTQYSTTVLSSLVATHDMQHWQHQRQALTQPFLPRTGLAPLFPRTVARAKVGADRLAELTAGGGPVDMGEFFMYEALAQLMHALFGETEAFQHSINRALRDAWIWRRDPGYLKKYALQVLPRVARAARKDDGPQFARALQAAADYAGAPSEHNHITAVGNLMLFSVAGHDTTGHTLTFLALELARNPAVQRRLQKEVDGVAASLRGRDLAFGDLHRLPYMTRCIAETLRLWPAVPQGTYRVTGHDDTVRGPGGRAVRVPKGTLLQICNWQLHRNPALWGADAAVFNPDRDFTSEELLLGRVIGRNPSSRRYSPFQHPPRDCLGRNFSLLEQRAILFTLMRRFSFEVTEPWRGIDPAANLAVSYGTMGPRDLSAPPAVRHWLGVDRVPMGLQLRVTPRA